MELYKNKYLKYKNKYLKLKDYQLKIKGGNPKYREIFENVEKIVKDDELIDIVSDFGNDEDFKKTWETRKITETFNKFLNLTESNILKQEIEKKKLYQNSSEVEIQKLIFVRIRNFVIENSTFLEILNLICNNITTLKKKYQIELTNLVLAIGSANTIWQYLEPLLAKEELNGEKPKKDNFVISFDYGSHENTKKGFDDSVELLKKRYGLKNLELCQETNLISENKDFTYYKICGTYPAKEGEVENKIYIHVYELMKTMITTVHESGIINMLNCIIKAIEEKNMNNLHYVCGIDRQTCKIQREDFKELRKVIKLDNMRFARSRLVNNGDITWKNLKDLN